jgi:TRAP-type mannitol/chloroaromatic compound transport system substrate-binding protein
MKMVSLKKRRIVAFITCVAFLLTLCGCAGSQPAANAPAQNEKKEEAFPTVHWTMTTSWPEGMVFFKFAQHFADEMKRMSGGRFTIDVLPGGAVVGALEALDAASKGTVQIAHTCANYAMGKHPSAVMFASVLMTFDPVSHLTWIYEGGGLEYWQKLYQEKLGLNVVTFPTGICGPDLLAWSNKKLSKLEDWKGVKYRTISWWGEVLKSIGVSVTSIPGAEIYPSLERGVIDAVEYATPTADFDLKFYEVSKYTTGPGCNQPDTIFELDINKDEWNKLPDAYPENHRP